MVESVFQTLLLLAYFNIALLSITIANYAVSASYLGRESRLSRWRMERRKKKLLEKLKEFRETTQMKSIKKEIGEAETEQKGLGRRIFLLSWLGAVILPSMFFIISFTSAVLGMNSAVLSQDSANQDFLVQQFTIYSSGTLATGFMVLLVVIRTIDSAAKKVPIPEFDVFFEGIAKALKLKQNQNATIPIRITNRGEDIAERVMILVHFPPSFQIHEPDYSTQKQGPESEYPDYNSAVILVEYPFYIDTTLYEEINVKAPDEKKTYEIPVAIYEEKIGVSWHKLAIEVVD